MLYINERTSKCTKSTKNCRSRGTINLTNKTARASKTRTKLEMVNKFKKAIKIKINNSNSGIAQNRKPWDQHWIGWWVCAGTRRLRECSSTSPGRTSPPPLAAPLLPPASTWASDSPFRNSWKRRFHGGDRRSATTVSENLRLPLRGPHYWTCFICCRWTRGSWGWFSYLSFFLFLFHFYC